jgi:hypothetical protein
MSIKGWWWSGGGDTVFDGKYEWRLCRVSYKWCTLDDISVAYKTLCAICAK